MSKQKFNGKTLYTKTCMDNILRVYDQSQNKSDWYQEANNFAHFTMMLPYKIHFNKCCGIIASLSPLKSWDENKRIAESFLSTGKSYHTKTMTDKAQRILDSDGSIETIATILNGNKITSFFLNIVDPSLNVVTIDRHAQDIAIGKYLTDDKRNMTGKQYNFFSNCYVIAAAKRNVRPNMMQSVTWEQWRLTKNQ